MHPAETHFILGIVEEAADVGAGLQRSSSSVLADTSDSACFCMRPLTLGWACGGSGHEPANGSIKAVRLPVMAGVSARLVNTRDQSDG